MAGKDATNLFNALHPPGTLDPYLPTTSNPDLTISSSDDEAQGTAEPRLVGLLDETTIVALQMDDGEKTKDRERTPLAQIIGLPDFAVSGGGILAWRCGDVFAEDGRYAVEEG
jgi:hypothetical protein